MKVLFVLEYYYPHFGGAEVLSRNLCEGLATKGHEVTIVTIRLPDTKSFEIINNVKVHRVKVPQKGDRYWFNFLSVPKVFQLARQADLIHTTTYNGAFPAWLTSKLRGKKALITVLEILGAHWTNFVGMSWLVSKLHQLLERMVIALPFDRHIAISQYTAKCLTTLGIAQRKIQVIYCGIDYVLFDSENVNRTAVRQKLNLGRAFIYLYYGRPGISKGVEYLVRAVPLIREAIPDSKLLLILANDPWQRYTSIKRMISDLGVENSIMLLNPVPRNELPSYIAAADCVVIPSLSEGFGFAAAEACAMDKAVVASDVGSLPEVVSGRCLLIEPEDPQAIATGVENVYNGSVRDSGKKIFDWGECVNSYLDVYADLLNAK